METPLDDEYGDADEAGAEFAAARFDAELGLKRGDATHLKEAANAVRQEFRDCSKWKRLRCRKVSIFSESDRGTVCVLQVGALVEFDWTWEGSLAFRPHSMNDDSVLADFEFEEAAYEDAIEWQGEVLEVDERSGCLFISLDNPEAIPTAGDFFVRPFEFLGVIDAVFNAPSYERIRETLPDRLMATLGGVHPEFTHRVHNALPQLQPWWNHGWSVLWGPPGTGKTWTVGQQVLAAMQDPQERLLIVSTTNRATDAVALAIGRALQEGRAENSMNVLRLGKGASFRTFSDAGLDGMLRGTASGLLASLESLQEQLQAADSWEEKALIRKRIAELRTGSGTSEAKLFLDPEVRAVVTTAFKAMSYLKHPTVIGELERNESPFTTIIMDEGGLLSRAAVAVLSYLAAHRVVLAGDSKQLAPISRISRVLPSKHEQWLAKSGLSHLSDLDGQTEAVHVLTEQRRMHPDVCHVVSRYQYGGLLKTASETRERASSLPASIADYSRTIGYVLDEENGDLASTRAQRGPGNKSWIRGITTEVLDKIFALEGVRQTNGLFISPYKAQAQSIATYLQKRGIREWEASTVHSQQGYEADLVVFDTVNAGSSNWPFDEWKRLVNVALSRAREAFIVLASRSEMEEPFLKPLAQWLTPSVIRHDESGCKWCSVDAGNSTQATLGTSPRQVAEAKATYAPGSASSSPRGSSSSGFTSACTGLLGEQFQSRKCMTPILSQEQQRLTQLRLDGKPRLVRGVAGSGKSIVLCTWLAKTVLRYADDDDARVWAVYANRSLHRLLRESIESAWKTIHAEDMFAGKEFPWEKVSLLHVRDVLAGILPSAMLSMDDFDFDYDRAAEEFMGHQDRVEIEPRCRALFIDEAQDLGPSTLNLLLALVEQSDSSDRNSRSVNIFYDNAQNIYGRKTPKWSDFGLDMRGRSTIMRESFRSTVPITELAVNVLHRLQGDEPQPDLMELTRLGLVESSERNGRSWLKVHFNQVAGPKPILKTFEHRHQELDVIFDHLKRLIVNEGVAPSDICLIYNGKSVVRQLVSTLDSRLREIGVEISVQTNRGFERKANTLVVTTANSFKGYEAEVVLIASVDHFVSGDGQVLTNALYVAMTRARALLCIYGSRTGLYGSRTGSTASSRIIDVISESIDDLRWSPVVEDCTSLS